jgi:GNAT superfamily N-acetyltransferase
MTPVGEIEIRTLPATDLSPLSFDQHVRENSERWRHLTDLVSGGRGRLLVAELGDEGTVVGYVALAWNHFYDRDFVDLLVVAPAARRAGVGSALLRAAVALATTATVFTSTNTSNAPMRALLARDGWLLSGTLDGLDAGDPEVVYYLPPSHTF